MALHLVTGYKGEAHISPEDIGAFNAGTFGSGEYVLNTGNKLAIEGIDNNNFKILDGDVMMQGRHITLKKGTYEQITINNGETGQKRNDLIVIRYEKNEQIGVENVTFAVVQGEPTTGTPTDPELATGDILSGNCLLHEMPLYRVTVTDYVVGTPEALFKTIECFANRIVTGSYKGNGAESQKIDLGFTPDAVYVCRSDGRTSMHYGSSSNRFDYRGGLALKGLPCVYGSSYKFIEIVNSGFKVFRKDYSSPSVSTECYAETNANGDIFYYIAIKLTGG